MAEDKTIAISVEIDGVEKSINTVKDLKDSIKKLQEQAEKSDFGSESYKNAVEELDRLNSTLKKVTQTEEQSIKSIEDLAKAEKEAIKETQDLRKQFEVLEDELFLLAGQGKQNTKQFKDLTVQAASLNKKIDEVNSSLGGNETERAAMGFSKLSEGLKNLDFKSVKEGLTGIKTALAATGVMLIVMAVSYLVANFDELSKGSGLLAKVLQFVGTIITYVTDKIYEFTDSIGLTTHELDKMGEKVVENAEKTKEALSEQTSEYDRLIAVAKANGESTVQLEIAKQKAIQATNAEILKQMLAYVQAGGVLDEEQQKLLKATLANVKDTHTAIQVIEATDKKSQLEKAKKHSDDLVKIKEDQYNRELELKKLKEGQDNGDEEFAKLLANIEREKLAKQTAYDEEQNRLTQSNIYYDSLRKQNQEASDEVARTKELEDNKQAQQDKANATLQIAAASLESTKQLTDLYFEFKRNSLQKGSVEELKAAKKQFQINKSLAIASATISGIQGVVNALSAQSVIPEPFGTILKVASAVGVGIAAAVNIAKISSSKFDGGGGGSIGSASGVSTPSVPIPSPPTLNTPSANTSQGTTFDENGKNTSLQQPTIKVNATIGVDEITSKTNRVTVLEKQATF